MGYVSFGPPCMHTVSVPEKSEKLACWTSQALVPLLQWPTSAVSWVHSLIASPTCQLDSQA